MGSELRKRQKCARNVVKGVDGNVLDHKNGCKQSINRNNYWEVEPFYPIVWPQGYTQSLSETLTPQGSFSCCSWVLNCIGAWSAGGVCLQVLNISSFGVPLFHVYFGNCLFQPRSEHLYLTMSSKRSEKPWSSCNLITTRQVHLFKKAVI